MLQERSTLERACRLVASQQKTVGRSALVLSGRAPQKCCQETCAETVKAGHSTSRRRLPAATSPLHQPVCGSTPFSRSDCEHSPHQRVPNLEPCWWRCTLQGRLLEFPWSSQDQGLLGTVWEITNCSGCYGQQWAFVLILVSSTGHALFLHIVVINAAPVCHRDTLRIASPKSVDGFQLDVFSFGREVENQRLPCSSIPS